VVLTDRRFSQRVYASRRPAQQPLPAQAKKVFARYPPILYVPGPQERLNVRQPNDLIGYGLERHVALCLYFGISADVLLGSQLFST
jgi:hypothetical protein